MRFHAQMFVGCHQHVAINHRLIELPAAFCDVMKCASKGVATNYLWEKMNNTANLCT